MPDDDAPNARRITSREYKLILQTDRFAERGRGVVALQDVVCRLAEQLGAVTERQHDEEARRTFYVDTAGFDLRRAGFLLRIRFEAEDAEFKVSLKHRTPDRYVAASRDLSLADGDDADLKFEEDILPPFCIVFSQSNAFRTEIEPAFEHFGEVVDVFPGLAQIDLSDETKLAVVNRFRPAEIFVKLCKLRFGEGPKVKCGLSFWYHDADDAWPLIAELAYDFEAESGDNFNLSTVEGAGRLYAALQRQPGCFDPSATTKTRFAYEVGA